MFNYNIENTQLSINKGKITLLLKGWAFDTERDINVKVIDNLDKNYSCKLQRLRRNDVFKYYDNNNNALDSGIILEIDSIKKNINKIDILFIDSDENVLGKHSVDIKKVNLQDFNSKISYENLKKIFISIKKDGVKLTYNKILNKLQKNDIVNNEERIIEPYFFIDEHYEYNPVNNNNVILIVNSTNNINSEKEYLETLKSVQAQNFTSVINLYSLKNEEIVLKYSETLRNCRNMKCENTLMTNNQILEFIKEANMSDKDLYYCILTAGDCLASSTLARIQEAIDNYSDKIITFNEDRILEGDYIAPLYKEEAVNKKRSKKVIFRKGLVIHESMIDNYLQDNINISDIHIINEVLYHYRVNKDSNKLSNVKPIAFYLPQYHAIPENDEWWGKGFTEWTNVRKGKPLFEGHYQPHVPGELGYYNLVEDRSIQYEQIKLAKEYGIYGFCYYYYWFNGKRLLEKPLDNLLADKGLDFPFCICWANETWSRRWDGQEKEILIKQEHNEETDLKFIEDIIPILKDERYIRVDKAPLLLVYRAELFPNLSKTIEKWKEVCKKNGIDNLHVSLVQSFGLTDPNIYGGDSAVEFPPHGIITGEISKTMPNLVKDFGGNIYDYRDVVSRYVNKRPNYYKSFRGTMLSWDNTARRGANSNEFAYATPEEYRKWLTGIVDYTTNYNDDEYQYIFINAWNEWAEGTHLEPDEKYGTEYLQATKDSLYANY